jgi:hypothetical protein
MFKIAEKLYLAKCQESSFFKKNGNSLIYVCCLPCRLQGNAVPQLACQEPEEKTEAKANYASFFLNIPNLEIPNYKPKDFIGYLDLMDERLKTSEVVLISENAVSRAPSLALLWLAFRGKLISASSYPVARADFSNLYPTYAPWPGWAIFFQQEWDSFKVPRG